MTNRIALVLGLLDHRRDIAVDYVLLRHRTPGLSCEED